MAASYTHPCAGDKCMNSPCCEDGLSAPKIKTDHRLAIMELEWKIQENLRTAHRCEAYHDPQNEIDYYYERNEQLQATVAFLKEQK